jgi:hypothetical protein
MKGTSALSVSITTGLLLIYVVFASLPFHFGIIFTLFLITSASLLWMVYRILTDTSVPVQKKFDDYFYQDADFRHTKER